jgi:hypothetical protein
MAAREMSILRRAFLVAALVVLVALPVLAFASPPDPSWIAGIYDGADYDDVVVLVTLSTADVSSAPVPDLAPDLLSAGVLPPAPDHAPAALWASAVLPRGPPHA